MATIVRGQKEGFNVAGDEDEDSDEADITEVGGPPTFRASFDVEEWMWGGSILLSLRRCASL